MPKAGKINESLSRTDKRRGSKSKLTSQSDQNVKIVNSGDGPGRMSPRLRRNMERVERLARPTARRLRSLWDEKCGILPPERRDKIKSALEEDYFLSPEQTEQYFQALAESSKKWSGPSGMVGRKEQVERARELRQRQKWLVDFSAQVAYRLCDYIAKGQKEMLVSNRLRSIADVVLERVAEILGEPKPSRTHPGRLARFMIAISDRIAVWIENAVYRAEALEPKESGVIDEHIRLDDEKTFLC
ncbi:uncharacterized protein LOC128200556 isoform X1 [Galleria mellonella]|uniref:Uncharacterized protein LOC128200556 isoform X1 n=1 Tax=Galleria mellonella TaxID=7137 RepID=A0ABM3MFY9_GALME|nr:uncharacterized protein LOC128200556 isoform X1 [Galleria mellonella]